MHERRKARDDIFFITVLCILGVLAGIWWLFMRGKAEGCAILE